MSLNRLLAMQKAAKEKTTVADASPSGSVAANAGGGQAPGGVVLGDSGSPPAPAPTEVKRLPFGKNVTGAKAKPVTGTELVTTTSAPTPTVKKDVDFDDLGNFDLSNLEVAEPESTSTDLSGFFDEIEATAPDRELDPDLTPGMLDFVGNLDNIYTYLNDAEMFGQGIRTVMMELQEHPEYDKLVSDQDVHVMIRAMRNTMGLARIKKQAKKRTTSGTSRAKTPSKKAALMDKALSLTMGVGFEVD